MKNPQNGNGKNGRNGREVHARPPTPGSEIWRRVLEGSDRLPRYGEHGGKGIRDDGGGGERGSTDPSGSAKRFRLRTLGGALLEKDGEPFTGRAARPYNLALLTLLAASPGRTASRDKLIACLWPTRNTSRARHRLSVALHVLRLEQELGPEAIVPSGDSLTLSRSHVWTDLGAFREAVREGRLEEAVALRAGPLLDGFYVSGAREFERWVEEERRSVEQLYRSALRTLIREAEDARRFHEAIRWYDELMASEPFCARVTMAFMQILAKVGHVERAIARARAYATLVEAKLGIPPDPDVMALARELVGEHRSEPFNPNLRGSL